MNIGEFIMRRKDREITDVNEILEIMKQCDVCNVAFFDKEYPYIVPLNFGVNLADGQFELYFHGANAGTKMELLSKNNHVGFEMSCKHNLILQDMPCNSTMEFESVCGNGIMEVVSQEEKVQFLKTLMQQYQPGVSHEFDSNEINALAVMRLKVNSIVGKRLKKKA